MAARAKALSRLSAAFRDYPGCGASARPLYSAVAFAVFNGATWEEIQAAIHEGDDSLSPSIANLMDYATLGGFVTRCDERDFRRAAQYLRVQGGAQENATLVRVGVMLEKMADSYAATIEANQERIQHGRRD